MEVWMVMEDLKHLVQGEEANGRGTTFSPATTSMIG
jgi:hypothetical protein